MELELIVTGILWLGFVMKIAGFMIRDELLLRVLVAGGLSCDAIFYAFRADPVWMSAGANVVLVAVNAVLLFLIVSERTTFRMTLNDRNIFSHFATLNPGQFRRLRRLMRGETVAPGTRLIEQNKEVADLILVLCNRIEIRKDGISFPIRGPIFVGEIAFLTGAVSSADVVLPDGGEIVRIDAKALQTAMERSSNLHNAMIALFGQDLARKVADSVPMARAASPHDDPMAPIRPAWQEPEQGSDRRHAGSSN
jgi:hypothetical protein